MEYKLIEARLKLADEGHGSLQGYASTFGNWDAVRERPIKGAFAKHLPDFLKDGFIAVGHNWGALPVATPTEATEDDTGLLLKADFHSTSDAQAARTVTTERLARGKSVKLSIGYEVLQDEYVDEGRLLKEIKLYEVSLVTVPANPMASVTAAKHLLEGGPLHAYAETVEAALGMYVRMTRDLHDRRQKAGRVFSEANLATMDASITRIADGLDTLRELRSRATTQDDEKTLNALELELMRFQAWSNGVVL